MAGVLKITDGTNEVSLLDASGLYITEWFMQVAPRLASGEFADVEEAIKCIWMATSDDARDTTMHTLHKLAEKADEFLQRHKLSEWVWLEARSHGETNSRYAILKEAAPKQLDKRHWGPNRPVPLELNLIREGAWRGVAPNGTPTTVVNATTIYNKIDSDGSNYITIDATDAKGDAPGFLILEIDPGTTTPLPQNFIIAHRTGTSSGALDAVTHLDADAELDNLHSVNSDAPDDEVVGATVDKTLRWRISAASDELAEWAGDYLVYAAVNGSGAGSATLQFRHGNNYVAGPEVAVSPVGSPATTHYLGRTTLPGGIYNPALTTGDYDLYLDIDISGVYTVTFFDLWLVPVGRSPFAVRQAAMSSGVLVIDGNLERTYEKTTGNGYQQSSSSAIETQGRYLKVQPGLYNRYYFFWTSAGELVLPNYNASVTAKFIPRFRAIRGNV